MRTDHYQVGLERVRELPDGLCRAVNADVSRQAIERGNASNGFSFETAGEELLHVST
jgi:hypothetical protein